MLGRRVPRDHRVRRPRVRRRPWFRPAEASPTLAGRPSPALAGRPSSPGIARRTLAVVLAAALLGACGVTTDPAEVTPEVFVEQPATGPEVVEVHGQDAVDEAYRELTDFALAHAFRDDLLDPQDRDFPADELRSAVPAQFTPDLAETWAVQVARAATGDPAAQEAVRVMQFHGWGPDTWVVPDDGSPVVTERIVEPRVETAPADPGGRPQLEITFRHLATLEFQQDGRPFRIDVDKDMAYWLVPSDEDSGPRWLIDAYDGRYDVSPAAR